MEEKKYKLNFELVPDSCWYSNLRSFLTPQQWDIVRKDAYARAKGKCMICGRPTSRLEAHEQWAYDEQTVTQILKNVVAVCSNCHHVIHIGRTQLMGGEEKASEWFMQVNGCTYADYRMALGKANEEHRKRNALSEWKLNLDWLFLNYPDFKVL